MPGLNPVPSLMWLVVLHIFCTTCFMVDVLMLRWTSSRWWSWELMYHGNPSRYQTEIHDQFSNPRRLIRLRALSEKQDMRLRRQLRELRSLGRVAVCCLTTWSLRYLEVIYLGPKMNRHCVASKTLSQKHTKAACTMQPCYSFRIGFRESWLIKFWMQCGKGVYLRSCSMSLDLAAGETSALMHKWLWLKFGLAWAK